MAGNHPTAVCEYAPDSFAEYLFAVFNLLNSTPVEIAAGAANHEYYIMGVNAGATSTANFFTIKSDATVIDYKRIDASHPQCGYGGVPVCRTTEGEDLDVAAGAGVVQGSMTYIKVKSS